MLTLLISLYSHCSGDFVPDNVCFCHAVSSCFFASVCIFVFCPQLFCCLVGPGTFSSYLPPAVFLFFGLRLYFRFLASGCILGFWPPAVFLSFWPRLLFRHSAPGNIFCSWPPAVFLQFCPSQIWFLLGVCSKRFPSFACVCRLFSLHFAFCPSGNIFFKCPRQCFCFLASWPPAVFLFFWPRLLFRHSAPGNICCCWPPAVFLQFCPSQIWFLLGVCSKRFPFFACVWRLFSLHFVFCPSGNILFKCPRQCFCFLASWPPAVFLFPGLDEIELLGV